MARTKGSKGIASYQVLELYSAAVKAKWTYDQLLKEMVTRFEIKGTKDEAKKKAAARIDRLNCYLRENFDGAELEILKGAPELPKTAKRLHELFSDAVIRTSFRTLAKKRKEREEEKKRIEALMARTSMPKKPAHPTPDALAAGLKDAATSSK